MTDSGPAISVPLLDLKPHLAPLREDIIAAIVEVVDSTQYIMGGKVTAFESAVADYVGADHAVGVSSGTDALLLALMGLNIGAGDWVITTPFSFFATAGVISRVGARPVFVDIDPVSFNLDPNLLRSFLEGLSKEDLSKVKAIIPVHLYGQCADMNAILECARQFEIPVIEDTAQAIGADYPGRDEKRRAGAIGTVGCFSFFPSKNLGAMGDAGMVTTNDDQLADALRIKRVHGGNPKYYHKVIGGNFRLDPIQAAVLMVKLPHLDSWHKARQDNADTYTRLFVEKIPDQIKTPHALYRDAGLRNYHIYNQYVIRAPRRDELRAHLADRGVSTEIYYPVPFHLQECFQYLGYSGGKFPESEKAALESIALPIYPELSEEQQTHVVERIAEFYQS